MTSTTFKMSGKIVAAVALAAAIFQGSAGAARAADAETGNTVVFVGADAREKSYYPYAGVVHHLNSDLVSDGVLLRLFGYYANYEYDSAAVAGGKVDADAYAFDAMVGYQKVLEEATLRGYVGLDFENHDLSPDNPLDANRGSDFGVKVQGEVETDYVAPYYGSLIASYGSAKERYWTRLRAGYDFSGVVVGPEGVLTGDNEFDEQRIGAFAMVNRFGPLMLTGAVGYSDTEETRGGGSPYVSVELSTSF